MKSSHILWLFFFCPIIISFVKSQNSDEADNSPVGAAVSSPDSVDPLSGSPQQTSPNDDECSKDDQYLADDSDSSSSKQNNNPLVFLDGFICRDYNFNFNALVGCYLNYFGYVDGYEFKGCQRSVLDLKGIFDFIEHHTKCDLVNEPDNTKCKEVHTMPDLTSDSSASKRRSDDTSSSTSNTLANGKLDITSSADKVVIKYSEYKYGVIDMFANDKSEGSSQTSASGVPEENQRSKGPHLVQRDGNEFPIRKSGGNSMKVVKDGMYNANYTIEINGALDDYKGNRRLQLKLMGKTQLWLSIQCFACGVWMDVKGDCNQIVINYMADEPKIVAPVKNEGSGEDVCILWKDGSTEKTKKREREYRQGLAIDEPIDSIGKPTVEESTTEEPTNDVSISTKKIGLQSFGDELVPVGHHG